MEEKLTILGGNITEGKSDARWESIATHKGAGVNAAQKLMTPSKKEQCWDPDALTKRIFTNVAKYKLKMCRLKVYRCSRTK